jgi:hypothetical protein
MPGAGVFGSSFSAIGAGVRGTNFASGGLAGDFQGNVNVTGDMTVGGNINAGGNINVSGDVFLTSKDVAECFDVDSAADCEAGMVMVLGDTGSLVPCSRAYDQRAIGVVSGAGGLRPAITLGAVEASTRTAPIALVGTTYCLVDADLGPVEIGDLMTSSETKGHAMKATDPGRAFCAIIGKALASLYKGRGAIPILISRQ